MSELLAYKRVRFGTRLPTDRRYTRGHYWVKQLDGLWRVGFTKFAIRMLGDIVEYQFDAAPGAPIEVGAKIGWIEGFKAVSEIYSAAQGTFGEANPGLRRDITVLESDPYNRGWLYSINGDPDPDAVDVHGYVGILDATIDKMLESRHAEGDH